MKCSQEEVALVKLKPWMQQGANRHAVIDFLPQGKLEEAPMLYSDTLSVWFTALTHVLSSNIME